jgi:hypothetical protein
MNFKKLIISVLFLSKLSVFAETVDEIKGFRGINFGSTRGNSDLLVSVPEMKEPSVPGYSYVVVPARKLADQTLYKNEIHEVKYEFWERKLYAIEITFRRDFQNVDLGNFQSIGRQETIELFGSILLNFRALYGKENELKMNGNFFSSRAVWTGQEVAVYLRAKTDCGFIKKGAQVSDGDVNKPYARLEGEVVLVNLRIESEMTRAIEERNRQQVLDKKDGL